MKPASLLSELRERGIRLSLRGDDIVYHAPKGAMTPELRESFRAEKQQIVQELRAQSNADEGEFDHLTRLLLRDSEIGNRHPHPYARFVEPIKSKLLSRVGLDVQFVRGEGCYLWDDKGNQILDCIAQYGGLPFGYNPDPIWRALESVRTNRLPNVATQSLLDNAGQLADRLLQLAPVGFEHVIFCNSGAEATEVAIKLCRAAKNRPGILSTRYGFHGLTTGSLSATGSESFQNGFFVRCDDFEHIPFGDAHALAEVLSQAPQQFAAFIVEPIQGEAGIVLPPAGYLSRVREICDQFDVLMVVDEVQTGLGRTGRLFACQHEDVVPDVMTLAKALGGGLVPVGAVLCQPAAYSIRFGLRHSSTFAGNALAAACGLATLAELTAENEKLVRHVAQSGSVLLQGLQAIQSRFAGLVREVRGCGYMLAIEFDFDSLKNRRGLMPVLVDQKLLLHLMISHLLHAHHVRVAPSFMGRDVIRLEPPLIAGKTECDQLLTVLTRTLETVEGGNAAALVANLIDLSADERATIESAWESSKSRVRAVAGHGDSNNDCPIVGEFGFLVHLSSLQDLVTFDQSLSAFTDSQLSELKNELTRSSEPTIVGSNLFKSVCGDVARGHFVLVPYTPVELLQMPDEAAIQRIAAAADVAMQTGVQLIGLGGFTSIITAGGIALATERLPPLTSGNAFTVAMTLDAIKSASHARDLRLGNATVAIVGASGQIGRALALMLSDIAGKIVLVGRDGKSGRPQQRLRDVGNDIVRHQRMQFGWTGDPPGKFRERLAALSSEENIDRDYDNNRMIERLIDEGWLVLAHRMEQIVMADIVVAVSNATEPFIESGHIKAGAIVCDSSRPANVSRQVICSRADVDWIEGGLVRIPGANRLDIFAGPRPDAAYGCVAESALWTLEPPLGKPSAQTQLDIATIRKLSAAGQKHGFEFVSTAF